MKPVPVSPDGHYYLTAAGGADVPHPYRLRWLLPRLLGPYPHRWVALTWVSLAATPAAAWLYFASSGLGDATCAFAAALLSCLPALRLPLRLPVLLDAPSFALALVVAAVARTRPELAAVLALPLGAMRETAPVFAAAWAWSPWPLVGVCAAGWWRRSAPPAAPWLAHPVRAALELRRAVGLDGGLYLRPWGAALAGCMWAAPANPSVLVSMVLAHLQLLAAQDTLRLVVWAAPPMCLSASRVLPPALWPLALAVTLLHRETRA